MDAAKKWFIVLQSVLKFSISNREGRFCLKFQIPIHDTVTLSDSFKFFFDPG